MRSQCYMSLCTFPFAGLWMRVLLAWVCPLSWPKSDQHVSNSLLGFNPWGCLLPTRFLAITVVEKSVPSNYIVGWNIFTKCDDWSPQLYNFELLWTTILRFIVDNFPLLWVAKLGSIEPLRIFIWGFATHHSYNCSGPDSRSVSETSHLPPKKAAGGRQHLTRSSVQNLNPNSPAIAGRAVRRSILRFPTVAVPACWMWHW